MKYYKIITISIGVGLLSVLIICFQYIKSPEYSILYGFIISIVSTAIALPTILIALNKYITEQQKATEKYLDLSLQTIYTGDYVSFKTQVINRTSDSQKIEYAFILISPQENWNKPIEELKQICQLEIDCTNDYIKFKSHTEKPFYRNNGAIISLPFYYDENLQIGNESPAFVYTLDNNIAKLDPGIYSIRFYIFPTSKLYHRSTVDSFIISKKEI